MPEFDLIIQYMIGYLGAVIVAFLVWLVGHRFGFDEVPD